MTPQALAALYRSYGDLLADLQYRAEDFGPKVCLSIVADLEKSTEQLREHFTEEARR